MLAYVGDAVFELYVRSRLVASGDKVKQLHREAIRLVSANAMAEYYRTIETNLTDTEAEVLHRGRNVKSHRVKSAGVKQYHLSTGFEALVGYLFLSGQEERLEEILGILFGEEQWAR
ncbi:MAG: Mini-ribonuclease 3 [Clostridiales bacterium]|nr:Mini-ribonuclease 3 [Clostridiales bacterium]